MPPRLVTGAILAFWLAMTAWLVQREVLPMMIAEASPSYTPDLTDEIGSPQVEWRIMSKGKRVGRATSQVIANDDRTYTFQSSYQFSQFVILGVVDMQNMQINYKVGDEGKLRSMATKVSASFKIVTDLPIVAEIKGEVIDDQLQPHLFINGKEEKLPDFSDVKLQQKGNLVNPMHLLNRLRGLRDGQTWTIAILDPMEGIKKKLPEFLVKQIGATSLIAEVSVATLEWNRREVTCFKIEYHERGKDVTARTWVRKLDGLVLQQESSQMGIDLVLQRVP